LEVYSGRDPLQNVACNLAGQENT